MTPADFQIPPLFDYAATVAWAVSGAVVGIRKRFDITGVFVIALLSATGGGLMRDAFLLRVPSFLTNPVYLPLIAGTTVVVALFTRLLTGKLKGRTVSKLVDVIDALGIPALAVIGMQLAEERGIAAAGVVFVGVVNGLGGGLLRDVVVRDVPTLLRPGQFTSLMLLSVCGLFLWLRGQDLMHPTEAALLAIGAFFLFRVIAVRFNWQSRPVAGDLSGDEDPGKES